MAESIVIFANSRYPYGAANSVNVFRMATAFGNLEYEVTLYGLRSGSLFQTGLWQETCHRYGSEIKTKVHLLWWPIQRGAEPFLAFVALLVLAFTSRRTSVYTRVRYVATTANFLGFRTYFESHSPPFSGLQKKIDKKLLRSRLCQFIMISDGLKQTYRKMGFPVDRARVAPDAGRVHRSSPPPEAEFHGPANEVGYIGSLHPGRGLELIMALAKNSPHRRFHIVGKRLNRMPFSNGHSSNVIFYDKVTPNQADRMAILFDVLLMPYQNRVLIGNGLDTSTWMSPMKMFEFMLSGRPVVASRLPAICEILDDSEDALLVDPANEEDWNEALSKLDDPKLRWKLASNAYHKASKNHTWELRARFILEDHDK